MTGSIHLHGVPCLGYFSDGSTARIHPLHVLSATYLEAFLWKTVGNPLSFVCVDLFPAATVCSWRVASLPESFYFSCWHRTASHSPRASLLPLRLSTGPSTVNSCHRMRLAGWAGKRKRI